MPSLNNTFNRQLSQSAVAAGLRQSAKVNTGKTADFLPIELKNELVTKGISGKVSKQAIAQPAAKASGAVAAVAAVAAAPTTGPATVSAYTGRLSIGDIGDLKATILNTQLTATRPVIDVVSQQTAMRFGYMPTAAEITTIRTKGPRAWMSGQLSVSDADFGKNVATYDARIRRFIYLRTLSGGLTDERQAELYNTWLADGRQYYRQLALTQRPFLHRFAQFLMNHFSISFSMSDPEGYILGLQAHSYFAHVILSGALGKFEDLLNATARFPGMLQSLTGETGTKGANPIQNYAREVMELHTVGTDSGYTIVDVKVMARLLTGMRFSRATNDVADAQGRIGGRYYFDPSAHDAGAKSFPFLGIEMAAYDAAQGDAKITQVLNALARHPATAKRFATKLVNHFVADDMSWSGAQDAVNRIAAVFQSSGGNLLEVLKAFVNDTIVTNQTPFKAPMPNAFWMGMVRAGGLITTAGGAAEENLLEKIQTQYLPMLNMPHWQAPDVRGFLVPNDLWVNDASIMIMLDQASMMAPQIAAKISARNFFNNTISALASTTASGSRMIVEFAASEPVNAIICTLMSPEFLKKA